MVPMVMMWVMTETQAKKRQIRKTVLSLELKAKIEEGVIQLPKEFEAYRNTFARIIILQSSHSITYPRKKD